MLNLQPIEFVLLLIVAGIAAGAVIGLYWVIRLAVRDGGRDSQKQSNRSGL